MTRYVRRSTPKVHAHYYDGYQVAEALGFVKEFGIPTIKDATVVLDDNREVTIYLYPAPDESPISVLPGRWMVFDPADRSLTFWDRETFREEFE